ncbi:hypothetical protein AWF16_24150 [Escherichia coli]|nr:hypothetical protein AWF56_19575 [Escherichia coli]KZQ26580.1 hypothetical protein A3N45_21095 [Klebsiella aerogenes]KUU10934.1 hypothetical protein AWF16_24150 [Escherichia coli]KUU57225.1 hypothetical protein AWF26_00420 [Escherichia coli]KUX12202.1 hypothetical protein AWF78_10680 [Escherichia coli]
MVPLLAVTGVTIIVAIWTSVALLFLLPVQFLVMKSLTRNEPMRFNLIAVWLRATEVQIATMMVTPVTASRGTIGTPHSAAGRFIALSSFAICSAS